MVYTKCDNCEVYLEIDENDYMPGCRDTEEAKCPKCGKVVASVFTSGIPTARIISKDEKEEIYKSIEKIFDMKPKE